MKNFKPSIYLFLLFVGLSFAQQSNEFLSRAYWKTNPTIMDIDKKIADGNDITELERNMFDAVSMALIEKTDNQTIKYLLSKKGNDVNKLTHDGRTYIFWAAYRDNLEIMRFLVEKGAKTDIIDSHGYSIANFAAVTGQVNPNLYNFCLTNGAKLAKDTNNDGANALLLVAPFAKDFSIIDYFVSKGISLKSTDNNGNGIFNYAAKAGNIPLMKRLIEKGVDYKILSKEGENAIIFASRGLRRKTNTLETFKYLVSLGVEANVTTKSGETPLHSLSYKSEDVNVFKYFIAEGVNVNQINDGGKTALTHAVHRNTPEVVAFLLEKGAKIDVLDKEKNNLGYYLLRNFNSKKQENFNKKLALLESKGFDYRKAQTNGNTLFHLALDRNDLELVKYVKSIGIDVNQQNKDGISPLHMAAMKAKNTTVLKYLLTIGADKFQKTAFEETVYDLAKENELLQQENIDVTFLK